MQKHSFVSHDGSVLYGFRGSLDDAHRFAGEAYGAEVVESFEHKGWFEHQLGPTELDAAGLLERERLRRTR